MCQAIDGENQQKTNQRSNEILHSSGGDGDGSDDVEPPSLNGVLRWGVASGNGDGGDGRRQRHLGSSSCRRCRRG